MVFRVEFIAYEGKMMKEER